MRRIPFLLLPLAVPLILAGVLFAAQGWQRDSSIAAPGMMDAHDLALAVLATGSIADEIDAVARVYLPVLTLE